MNHGQPHKPQPLAQIQGLLSMLHHPTLCVASWHQDHAVVGLQKLVDVCFVYGAYTKPPPEVASSRHIQSLQLHK